jgi:GNAT superfamily N-acetyltransferase
VSASTGASATGSPRMATAADGPLVTRILVDAFHDDPMWGSWAFPDPHTRQQGRVAVFGLLVEGAMRYPWVWLAADDAATAVWIPPGGSELSPAQEQQIDSVLLFAEARPTEPHYYLTLLGTDPAHHGRGVGQRLLAANLGQVVAAGAPAYLEAGDELVPLYERFGFRTLKRFALTDGPTVNGMWREPRADGPGGAVRRPRRP